MKRVPKVKDVMTAFPFTISANKPMSHAKSMMKEHGVGHLPVILENGDLSIISFRELERVKLPGHSHTDFDELTVGDLCPVNSYQVDMHTSLIDVLDYMSDTHCDCVLVTRHEKLAGVFTLGDACSAYSRHLKDLFFPSGPDSAA